jgi:hypothetical protein
MSYLQALNFNPFNSHLFPLVLRIKSIVFSLYLLNYTINFIWILSHTGIHNNKFDDNLAKSTSNFIFPSLTQLPHSDFTPYVRRYTSNLWSAYWNNLPATFASRYRDITPHTLKNIWFKNLDLQRSQIIQFNRLCIGHSLLPSHSFNLGLNNSSLCTLHLIECICDLPHILFTYPTLISERQALINSLRSLNCSFNLHSILNINCTITIKIIIRLILDASFII